MHSVIDGRAQLWLYGDVGCPWSYLALARIRKLSVESRIVVGWRPLPRCTRSQGRGVPAVSNPGGEALPSPEAVEFERLGLPFQEVSPDSDSRDALLALEFARDLGRSTLERSLDGLFAANFTGQANLGDREELLDLCQDLGLDRTALGSALDDGRYEAELDLAEAEAERYGIQQIPTILAGRLRVVGAAPEEVLAKVVRESLRTD
jgi:predicted DsbA family dithiol-disulfide isomerase